MAEVQGRCLLSVEQHNSEDSSRLVTEMLNNKGPLIYTPYIGVEPRREKRESGAHAQDGPIQNDRAV